MGWGCGARGAEGGFWGGKLTGAGGQAFRGSRGDLEHGRAQEEGMRRTIPRHCTARARPVHLLPRIDSNFGNPPLPCPLSFTSPQGMLPHLIPAPLAFSPLKEPTADAKFPPRYRSKVSRGAGRDGYRRACHGTSRSTHVQNAVSLAARTPTATSTTVPGPTGPMGSSRSRRRRLWWIMRRGGSSSRRHPRSDARVPRFFCSAWSRRVHPPLTWLVCGRHFEFEPSLRRGGERL